MSIKSVHFNQIPPPASPAIDQSTVEPKAAMSSTKRFNAIDECIWAAGYPELQKACFLSKVCAISPPKRCQFRNIRGIVQKGPTCGLTALSMLLGGTPSPEQLLTTAKELMFTNNGEMFSAQNLFQLICDNLLLSTNGTPADASISTANAKNAIECQLFEGRLNCAKVKENLQAAACIFVPYDPDFNHAPCLKFGHKAHWALIIGYLISENDEFFVIARHGKAKNLAVWSLRALSSSNSNLMQFSQPKRYPDCDFLLPEGGISGDLGLRERAIIVNGIPNETITIG